jgi:ATP-dependent helicase/nuclease subunit B
MSVRFVIGRAGSGKSRFCLDEIRQRLREDPAGNPLILLVPEQATFQAEYELVTTPGMFGILRAQAISFRRLAFRVMQECGGTARIHIDDTGKRMLLFKILQSHKDKLTIFRRAADQRGFVSELTDLFNEFRRYRNSAKDLDDVCGRAVRRVQGSSELPEDPFLLKLQDIRLIYHLYEDALRDYYVDSEHYLQTLAEQAPRSSYLRDAELWIDGFSGFTPQEYMVIEALFRSVRRVTVTLCADRIYEPGEQLNELNMFHSTAVTMTRLKQLAEEAGVPVEQTVVLTEAPRYREAPMLAHLEKYFADRFPPAYLAGIELLPDTKRRMADRSQVKVAAAVNPRAEIEAAARQILNLTQHAECRFRDIAVITRNMETYGDLIATVFQDHGIPFFIDHKKSVLNHPVVELIRSAMEIVIHHWRYESIFRCVKTDLISDDRKAMDELENYALAFGIEGARWTDGKRWEYAFASSIDEEESEDKLDEVTLARIHRSRMQVVTPLKAFEEQFRAAENVREQMTAIYELLERLRVPEKLVAWSERALAEGKPEKAKEHSTLWNRLIGLFDQIVEMLGSERMTAEQLASVLDTGLESMKLSIVPPSLDQVLVGTLDRTRFGAVRHVFVVGVNDGVIPAKMTEGGILSEADRESAAGLGMQLAPDNRRKLLDEQFLAYTGFTLPSHGLWISYSLADEEGKSLLPSEFVKRILRMFPGLASTNELFMVDPSMADETGQADYIIHPERSLSYLIVQLRSWMRGGELPAVWREALRWYARNAAWRSKLEHMLYAFRYTNGEPPLSPEVSRLLYGSTLTASVSRMERFAACPFMQFASHGLRLKERRIYRLEPPHIGQLFHAALNRMAKRMIEEGIRWRDLSPSELARRAEEAVEWIAPRLQGEILYSSRRYLYMSRKLKGIVSRTAHALGDHAKRGDFEPVALELGFGPGETLRPAPFILSNGARMELVGRIDRVDAAPFEGGELLRVIDYKSGDAALSLQDVYDGLSLQLLTYLDVVISQAEQWRGKPAIPGGALYFHVHHPIIQSFRPLTDEEREEALLKEFKMNGLVSADKRVILAMDNQLTKGRSPIIPVGIKADGGFYSESQVADEQQLSGILRFVRNKMKKIGDEIVEGRVEIKPYRKGKRSPCAHCVYRPVCQFDIWLEDNDYRHLPNFDRQELWKRIIEQKEEA